jgi:PAS domain-containing protein
LRDEAGQIIGVTCDTVDITERKRAEEALHRYELLSAHSRDIILFMKRDGGRILEANAAAMKAYGYNRDKLLSLTTYLYGVF